MMLIGGGGDGNSTDGGGSGAVTVWYGAAQHVPDVLQVYARATTASANHTEVAYLSTDANFVTLLEARTSSSPTGGVASSANYFGNSGFYQNTTGADGFPNNASASSTTFLSGGAGPANGIVTANYGYTANSTGSNGNGYFQLQPIIVGVGSAGTGDCAAVGCGSGESASLGGQGFVLIASW